jgi:hypothetical protein
MTRRQGALKPAWTVFVPPSEAAKAIVPRVTDWHTQLLLIVTFYSKKAGQKCAKYLAFSKFLAVSNFGILFAKARF